LSRIGNFHPSGTFWLFVVDVSSHHGYTI
jgi:hypothetical protein